MKLFVYGTLLSGERAHERLRGAPRVAVARTVARFSMVDLGPYPALIEGGETEIHGEVYEVDEPTLLELDAYEGVPDDYRRVALDVSGHWAWVYVLAQPDALSEAAALVASGDWRAHRRARGADVTASAPSPPRPGAR